MIKAYAKAGFVVGKLDKQAKYFDVIPEYEISCVIMDWYENCFISDSASSASKVVETKTNDIVAMISPEKERVPLGKVQ